MSKATLQSVPVSVGQTIDLTIDSMAYDNSAIGRYRDFVVMVDRGAPHDHVVAEITTVKSNYARAKILEIKSFDSDYRIEPECKIFKVCGGCQWQHLPYEKQLEQKKMLLQNFFANLKLSSGVLKDIAEAEQIWHYRNKVQYPVRTISDTGRLKAGYFEWHSNDLVNIKFCSIQHNLFDKIVETVRELAPKYKITAYSTKEKKGWLRHICVRTGFNTSEALLTLVAADENLSYSQDFACEIMDRHKELVGVCFNINTKTTNVIYGEKTKVIRGKGYIYEKVGDLKFKISATSFFQVNTSQTIKLLEIIESYADLKGSETILDIYSGGGLMSLYLAKKAKKVIGIEEIGQSIEDAKSSAKENNIKNTTFILGKVENKIKEVLENESPEIVILDPPRSGCNKGALKEICEYSAKKIIYVSCNPSTLTRDLEICSLADYNVKSIQPIDLFPHSYHIECVALLERQEN